MKLLALPKYPRIGPSSRLRLFQFLPYLQSAGISVQVQPLVGSDYIRKLFSAGQRPLFDLFFGYWNRLRLLNKIDDTDLIWIEKELFPWIPGVDVKLLNKINRPFVVDYDDAVFHLYDQHHRRFIRKILGKKIGWIMHSAKLVTVGNTYLADYAERAGADCIQIIPTVVDTMRYGFRSKPDRDFCIGWIGSPITQRYLENIRGALEIVVREDRLRLVLVGASNSALRGISSEIVQWSEETEVESIQKFDVGIMPLPDNSFERGKCGYKLIQCMACGVPVVASPVGINQTIVQHGVHGYHARTQDEWVSCLRLLAANRELREKMGRKAREKVMREFALSRVGPLLAEILTAAAKR
ncbi:glycosyltransferase family 4 protein [Desulfatitalea alkaliphila]|uniref:Glycosyltransferase family 4 protein n=1 Tax=Desulfatitalea alkaliphila TaxID=2929485 RepID=A0AA41R7M7_9BACT|nr:glycosyltransferase family 4 protein [Desulfatitalea alkaliphila]MCJ8502481.1 glycosyltransferase family 4 protein [Desulfatitalea alkaliphila]